MTHMDGSFQTFQILGLALGYPRAEFVAVAPELMRTVERERLLQPDICARVAAFFEAQAAKPLLDVEERYAATFDGGRLLSLHLFEHVYGDGKERGKALAELSQRYAELGMLIDGRETPDYLPALCELATVCGQRGLAVLAEARPVIELLARSLFERQSPYALLVQALVEALGAPVAHVPRSEGEPATDDGMMSIDLDALDRDWVEAPVTFGVAAAHDALVPLRRSKDSAPLVVSTVP
jgi:nitrate reductase delta subunit